VPTPYLLQPTRLRLQKIVLLPTGAELIVLVFEQDVERGERSVTARDILLQVDLVRFA